MENTTHLFLATRFNCNKCHDHPFERWTQDQYYHLGAFFAQVQLAKDPQSGARRIGAPRSRRRGRFAKSSATRKAGEMTHLRTNKVAAPQFPFAAQTVATAKADATRREQLAAWMTSPDNRYFATSYVNRIWGYLTGVGVIEPLDDIRAGNPPTNPELLDYLTKEFIEHEFDVRHVMRLICKSRTYQLSIATNKWNEDDKINYSHATARRLPAEVLYDAVLRVTGSTPQAPRRGARHARVAAPGFRDRSARAASSPTSAARRARAACECERSSDLRLGSVMACSAAPPSRDAIGDPNNALAKLAARRDGRSQAGGRNLPPRAQPPRHASRRSSAPSTPGRASTPSTRMLDETWQAKEAEQAPIIAKMEKERVAAIAAAKTELARYEEEIAPKVAAAEKKPRVAARGRR